MSFPLNTECYRIDNRNYRRNPYKPGNQRKAYNDVGDTPDMYPEDEDAEDGPSCEFVYDKTSGPREVTDTLKVSTEAVKEHVEEEDNRIIFASKHWIANVDVPKYLYGKLIGTKGRNLHQLEESTGCRVKIPKTGTDGFVVVTSNQKDNVCQCLKLIDNLMTIGRNTARFTHFVAFPCNHPNIINSYITFRERILNSTTASEDVKDEQLFCNPHRLHITISLLWLYEVRDSEKAKMVLGEAVAEIQAKIKENITVTIKGVSIMNDDPYSADVVYANIYGNSIQQAANIIYEHMSRAELSPEVETGVSTTAHPVKLHMTVMNSRKKAQRSSKKRISFDASTILEEYKDYEFGTITMERVSICVLGLGNGDGEKYYSEIADISLKLV